MNIYQDGKYFYIQVPGLKIYCTDPDYLYSGLMLIDLGRLISYAPENPKRVLLMPGEGEFTITQCKRSKPVAEQYSIRLVTGDDLLRGLPFTQSVDRAKGQL